MLEQAYVRDQNKTVNDVIVETIAVLGEKISVRRFERFNLGEGLEKKETNLAEEVAKQTEKKKEEPKDTKSSTSTADVKEEEIKSDVKV